MMSWMGRQLWRLAIFLAVLAIFIAALHLATRAPADLRAAVPPDDGTPVWVVDHGYHSGLIISPAALRAAAVKIGLEDAQAANRLRWLANLYPDADWLEIGWGDAAFYRQTPGLSDVDILLGLQALLWPTEAVLQVVPGWGTPEAGFPRSAMVRLDLADQGLTGIAGRLARTVPEPAPRDWLGPSLYGVGAFYPARLDYHLFRTCNQWLAWVLRGAGAPASPVTGTFSTTLMMELRWRLP